MLIVDLMDACHIAFAALALVYVDLVCSSSPQRDLKIDYYEDVHPKYKESATDKRITWPLTKRGPFLYSLFYVCQHKSPINGVLSPRKKNSRT